MDNQNLFFIIRYSLFKEYRKQKTNLNIIFKDLSFKNCSNSKRVLLKLIFDYQNIKLGSTAYYVTTITTSDNTRHYKE